jgi:hypothetical protein
MRSMTFSGFRSLVRAACVLTVVATTAACGGSKDSVTPSGAESKAIDADPAALLPSSAMMIARVDAKAMLATSAVGAQLGQIAERLVPIGEESGFRASRDLDAVLVAAYSLQGADVLAVLSGTFDEKKISDAAAAHTPTKAGGVVVATDYLGRKIYTVSNVGFTVLSSKTVLAGTDTMIRRSIERIKDGKVQRDQPPWMLQTLESANAALAGAADFTNQPVGAASVAMVPLGWVKGLKAARLVGNFKEPGLNIAATLTYPDAASAQDNAEQVKRTANMANLLAVIGAPQLKNLDIKPKDADVQISFAVDDQALRTFVGSVQQYVPQR